MNIILIAETNHYRDWIGKTYSDILTHYKRHSRNNITLFYYDENIYETTITNLNPNIIICFDTNSLALPSNFNFIFELGIPVFYCGLDLFYLEIAKQCPNIANCKGIIHFSHASKLENSYRINFPNKAINHLSARFVNTNRFRNYNREKIYDILIYGTREYHNYIEYHDADQEYKMNYERHYGRLSNPHNFYPLRTKIERLMLQNTGKYRVHIVKQACIYDAPVANEALSELINQSYLTLACSTRADIAMSKYFEIAASYSGILGDIPSDYNYLFKGNIVEVNFWMSDEEILNIIDKALENKTELWEMTQRLSDRVHTECSLDAGTINMDDVFGSLL